MTLHETSIVTDFVIRAERGDHISIGDVRQLYHRPNRKHQKKGNHGPTCDSCLGFRMSIRTVGRGIGISISRPALIVSGLW